MAKVRVHGVQIDVITNAEHLTTHVLEEGTDLDTLKKTGIYGTRDGSVSNTLINIPSGTVGKPIVLFVFERSVDSWAQLLISNTQKDSTLFIRATFNQIWNAWTELYSSANSQSILTRLAALEAKNGITYEPPIEGPDFEEELPMDENLLMGGYSELYVVSLLPALVGGALHG